MRLLHVPSKYVTAERAPAVGAGAPEVCPVASDWPPSRPEPVARPSGWEGGCRFRDSATPGCRRPEWAQVCRKAALSQFLIRREPALAPAAVTSYRVFIFLLILCLPHGRSVLGDGAAFRARLPALLCLYAGAWVR